MIVNCTIIRLKDNESLEYLAANGHEVSRMTYYRIKRRVEEKKLALLYEIAKIGFVQQHIERIDQRELIQRENVEAIRYGGRATSQGSNIGKNSQCPTIFVIILRSHKNGN